MNRGERERGRRGRQLLLRGITLFLRFLDATSNRLVFSLSFHSLAPQLSVPCGRGLDGRGMRRLFGLASRVSETGQRGTQSHSAASRTLDRFLELGVKKNYLLRHTSM